MESQNTYKSNDILLKAQSLVQRFKLTEKLLIKLETALNMRQDEMRSIKYQLKENRPNTSHMK